MRGRSRQAVLFAFIPSLVLTIALGVPTGVILTAPTLQLTKSAHRIETSVKVAPSTMLRAASTVGPALSALPALTSGATAGNIAAASAKGNTAPSPKWSAASVHTAIEGQTSSASPALLSTQSLVSPSIVSGPDEFDVKSTEAAFDKTTCQAQTMSNGELGRLCTDIYINQGFSTSYAASFQWKLIDACGTVIVNRTISASVQYLGAGYYFWNTSFPFPWNEPANCDGTWTMSSTLSQGFPDGQTLTGTVTGSVIVQYDAPATALDPAQAIGGSPVHASQADPVDSYTGAFNDHMGSDLSLGALGGGLAVQRSYSSNTTRTGPFGSGWTFNYGSGLSADPSTGIVIYHDASGALETFIPNGAGGYTPPPGVSAILLPQAVGGFTLTKWDMTQQVFNGAGQLTTTKDRNGQGATLTYNGTNLAAVAGSGRSLTFTWDSTGTRITRVDSSDLRNVQFGYDSSLNLVSAIDPLGKATTYTYDSGGRLNSIRDPNGNYPARLVYDSTSGRATQQQDANGAVTYFSWDSTHQTATTTDPRGLASQDQYLNGYLIQQTDGAGNATRYSWDSNGRMIRVSTPAGQTTTFQYDSRGNTTAKISPDVDSTGNPDPTEHYTYDSNNNLLSSTDFNGNGTTYVYDTAGNVITVSQPNVTTGSSVVVSIQNSYNTNGTLTTSTDADGGVTHYGYDTAGDVVSVTSPAGRTATYGFDGAGRETSMVSPRGNVPGANAANYTTSFLLNADGQITNTVAPLSIATSTNYDNGGRPVAVTDARGKTTTATYDANGHATAIQGPDPTIAPERFTYDSDGNFLTDTSPGGIVTTSTYNSLNKRATTQSTGAGKYTYAYDSSGRLTTETSPSGHTTSFQWGTEGTLASVNETDGTTNEGTSYSYDANGNRLSMGDSLGSARYVYNALNQITSASRGSNTWSYGYDNTGRTVSRTTPGSAAQQLTYDPDGRLTKVAAGTTNLVTYAYNDTTGSTVATLPGGLTQTTSIDAAGRPAKVTGAKGATTLTQSTYTLDPNGNPIAIADASGTTDTYAYDASSHLSQVCYSTTTCTGSTNYIKWTYNGDANRLTETRPAGTTAYTYNSTGQLSSKSGASGAATYTYDADGHMTSDGTNTYKWDLAGNLTSAGTSKPTTYSYDGEGRRLSITNGNTVVDPIWDPTTGQLNEETNGTGSTLRSYAYGTSLVGLSTGGATYSYLTDLQGSVRAVVDSTGVAQWTYSYEPYGASKSAVSGGRLAPTNTRKYLSALTDGSSYDLTARQYQPGIGQFLSPDPAAIPGIGYQYGNANPMSQIDPSGRAGSSWLSIAAGINGGAAATSGSVSANCTTEVWCSQLTTGSAPLAGKIGAVSWTASDTSSSCVSAKGACTQAVVAGALNGNAAGGGLHNAAKMTAGWEGASGALSGVSALTGFLGLACDVTVFGAPLGAVLEGISLGTGLAALGIDCFVLKNGPSCALDSVGLATAGIGAVAGKTAAAMTSGAHALESGADGYRAVSGAGAGFGSSMGAASSAVGLGSAWADSQP